MSKKPFNNSEFHIKNPSSRPPEVFTNDDNVAIGETDGDTLINCSSCHQDFKESQLVKYSDAVCTPCCSLILYLIDPPTPDDIPPCMRTYSKDNLDDAIRHESYIQCALPANLE